VSAAGHILETSNRDPHQAFLTILGACGYSLTFYDSFTLDPHI